MFSGRAMKLHSSQMADKSATLFGLWFRPRSRSVRSGAADNATTWSSSPPTSSYTCTCKSGRERERENGMLIINPIYIYACFCLFTHWEMALSAIILNIWQIPLSVHICKGVSRMANGTFVWQKVEKNITKLLTFVLKCFFHDIYITICTLKCNLWGLDVSKLFGENNAMRTVHKI